jgi:type I restriction enzyme, S subunit
MEVRKRYKDSEVGLIPIDWEVVKLGDLFSFKNGLNKEKRFFGQGTPIVNYMDVYQNRGLSSSDLIGRVTLSNQEIKNYEVRKGDVFFTRTSETVEEIGITSVMLDDVKDTVFSGFVLRARPINDKLDDNFKKYCFSSYQIRKEIISKSSYTTRALTNGKLLSEVSIPLPPTKAEQTAIATALSDADALIQSLEKLIAKKRLIKQGAMQELLKPKEGWVVKKLGDCFQLSAGKSKSGYIDKSGLYIIMDMGAVSAEGKIITNKRSNISQDMLDYGDLIMPKDDIGGGNIICKVAFIDSKNKYILGDHVYRLRKCDENVDPLFFHYLINSNYVNYKLKKKVSGSAQLGIGRKSIEEQEVIIPKIMNEQSNIAIILSDMDAEIDLLESKLEKYKQIKQGMMQNLLTGKIRLV